MTRNGANVAKFTLGGCPAPAAAVFRPPYARTIERLLDGNHTGQQHPTGALAAELRTDDSVCTGWSRAAPARLYYATRDEQVVNATTFACQAALAAHGAQVPVIDLGTPLPGRVTMGRFRRLAG